MGRELDRALECLQSGLDEAEARIVLREDLRLSKKAADYFLASAKEVLTAKEAPKTVVRNRRNELVAQAVAEEGALREGQRLVVADRAIAQKAALDASFLREFEEIAKRTMTKRVVIKPSILHRKKSPIQRTVNVVLSDLHFGANLDGRELPIEYGPKQEARRFSHIMQQVGDYKPQYRDHSSLNIHVIGDVIHNVMHGARSPRELALQNMSAISYLVQGIGFQAANWREVNVYCLPGNHDRFLEIHPKRAVDQKWNSHGTVIYFAVKMALAHLPNVHVHLYRTPFYVWESYGEHGFATHSDTVHNVGQPNKKIDIASIEAQVHEKNDAFRQEGKPVCKVWICGHAHRVHWSEMDTGEIIIGNGALVPVDGYAVSLGKLTSSCAQVLFESVAGHIAGDFRSLRVGRKQDKDASLDLVKPFEDFIG